MISWALSAADVAHFQYISHMRLFLCFLLSLCVVCSNAFSQAVLDCNPDFFQAVDDTYTIDEADLPQFNANLLSNDVIDLDLDGVAVEGLPSCFGVEQGTGFIFYSGGNGDGSDCCGIFTFSYKIFSADLVCAATVRITVACETSKGDCTVIELGPEGNINPDEPAIGDTSCVYVCENGISTVLEP